jgi:undecaprenyl-diphosphatase
MSLLHNFLLSFIEGLTEYLPISSTGHIIITSWFLGINEDQFTKDFTVMVQFGAILAVLFLYRRRFLVSLEFYKKLFVGVLPAVVIGLSVKNYIDLILGSVWVVAISLIAGGIVLILVEKRFPQKNLADEFNYHTLTYKNALLVGLIQCFAFIPGVSRSAASILGGMSVGLTRKAAAEFSFFLAVPTLSGASLIKFLKIYPSLSTEVAQSLLIGNFISFLVGAITIKLFISYLSRHNFVPFGYYRIFAGAILIGLLLNQ